MELKTKYQVPRIKDRQITELIGMARGMIADGELHDKEVEYLEAWLAASEGAAQEPMVVDLLRRVTEVRADGVIEDDERQELFEALARLTGSEDFVPGEALKATTLPLCNPAPDISFAGRRFTFTGIFVYGQRKDCEEVVIERGGACGVVSMKTDFVVIGGYASDSWAQSSFGRKIEKAVEYRDRRGAKLHIISEAHWQRFL